MALKFRRTLSMEDLKNASDEEMDDLLSSSDSYQITNAANAGQHHNKLSTSTTPRSNSQFHPSAGAVKNGIRIGPILAPGIDSPENDDFFLHGPQAPILNLDNADLTPEIDTNLAEPSQSLPRSKSVRFQEPEETDRMTRVRNQVDQVTGRMKDNVARLLDREASLDSLQDLSDQLQYSSDIYRQSSEHLRRKMWWRQQRTRLVLGAVFIIGIFLLIIPIITKFLQ